VLKRRGVQIRTNTRVKAIHPDSIELPDGQTIAARTIIVATGVAPSPLVAELAVDKDHKGRVKTDATMRVSASLISGRWETARSSPTLPENPTPARANMHCGRPSNWPRTSLCPARRPSKTICVFQQGHACGSGPLQRSGKGLRDQHSRLYRVVVWRTYYLMRMPHWSRRLRVVIDWTIALFFRNDVVQLDITRGNRLPTPPTPPPPDVADATAAAAPSP